MGTGRREPIQQPTPEQNDPEVHAEADHDDDQHDALAEQDA